MKKAKRTLIKSFITLFVLLSCIIFSLKTFSWFAVIKETHGKGIGAEVSEESVMEISDVLILKKNSKGQVINVSGDENVSLSEYDPLMSGRKFNTPLIMITKVLVPSNNSVYLDFCNVLKYDNNPWKVELLAGDYLTNYISNVIEVRSTYCEDIDLDMESDNYPLIYETCLNRLDDDSISNPQTFVQYSESNSSYMIEEKKQAIAFNYLGTEYSTYVNSLNYLTVVYEIDYSDILVNEFIRMRNAVGIVNSERLVLNGDLTHILFKDGVYNE